MGGLGLTLSTAKDALLAQRIALDVVSQNVANVNTPGYTRQTALLEARDPSLYAGLVMGRGVSVENILRDSNGFIEARLQAKNSDLAAFKEEEVYMNSLESIFNENSGASLGVQLSEFWGAWDDLANNPSGDSERNILYEKGALLAQSFKNLSGDLLQMDKELDLSIEAGVGKVNELLTQIADLNPQIVSLKVEGNANDLLDKRNNLITQLSEYIDLKTYEDDSGNLTVTTGKGYTLVAKSDYYSLHLEGDRVMWQSSGENSLDITDTITGGKLGGWLEMRDSILPGYQDDLNELAKSVIGEVNKIHSQGVGLAGFSEATATNAVEDPDAALTAGGIPTGTFSLWLYDPDETVVGGAPATITVSSDTTLTDLVDQVNQICQANGIDPAALSASESGGRLTLTASNGYSFAFSADSNNVLAGLGVNTFFTGEDANNIDVNSALGENKGLIAAARVDDATGEIAAGDNTNALALSNLQDADVAMTKYQYTRGEDLPTTTVVNDTLENYLFSLVGSVGIKSQSVIRSREYGENVVNQLTETRDNISAVSIDEEMTNLIKYQQAYSAAAKLISTADEMFQTLLDTKQ